MSRLFVLIFALTATDAICTAAGLRVGVIEEANPLLCAWMTARPELTGALICAAVGALLLWIYSMRERAPWLGAALSGVAAVKLGVLGLHFGWIVRVVW